MWCLLSLTSVLTKYLTKQYKLLSATTGPLRYWSGKSFSSDSLPTPNMYGNVIPSAAASNSDAIYGTLSSSLSYVPNVLLSGKAVSGGVFLVVARMFLMHTTHKWLQREQGRRWDNGWGRDRAKRKQGVCRLWVARIGTMVHVYVSVSNCMWVLLMYTSSTSTHNTIHFTVPT